METCGRAKTLRKFLGREERLPAAHAEADRAGLGGPHRLAAAKIEDARHVGAQGLPVQPFGARPHVNLEVLPKAVEGHHAAFGIRAFEAEIALLVYKVRYQSGHDAA